MNGASERANGGANGPVLVDFIVILPIVRWRKRRWLAVFVRIVFFEFVVEVEFDIGVYRSLRFGVFA